MTNKNFNSATRRAFMQASGALTVSSFLESASGQSSGTSTGAIPTPVPAVPVNAPSAASIGTLTPQDQAILRFSVANELIGGDLWTQYANQVLYNSAYTAALRAIDPMLPRYILDTVRDELSHGTFLTALAAALGVDPVNLDAFRTLPDAGAAAAIGYGQAVTDPQLVTGLQGINAVASLTPPGTGRIVNLTSLNIDTSFFNKYRTASNPDVQSETSPLTLMQSQATIATSSGTGTNLSNVAAAAVMHMSFNEQGEASTYVALGGALRNRELLGLMSTIMPVEMMHYAVFQAAGAKLGSGTDTSVAPATNVPNIGSQSNTIPLPILPAPAPVLAGLPNVSVIRPKTIPYAGAVAISQKLAAANYFAGQPVEFTQMMMQMARAADTAGTMAVLSPKGITTTQSELVLSTVGSKSGTGGELTYSMSVLQGSASLSQGSTGAFRVQFLGGPGPYTFQLTVTDALGNQSSDIVTIMYAGR